MLHSFELLATALLLLSSTNAFSFGPSPAGWEGKSTMNVKGSTGVAAMQLTVTTNKKMYARNAFTLDFVDFGAALCSLIIDRVENNPLKKNGKPVWAADLDIASVGHSSFPRRPGIELQVKPRALSMVTNSVRAFPP